MCIATLVNPRLTPWATFFRPSGAASLLRVFELLGFFGGFGFGLLGGFDGLVGGLLGFVGGLAGFFGGLLGLVELLRGFGLLRLVRLGGFGFLGLLGLLR